MPLLSWFLWIIIPLCFYKILTRLVQFRKYAVKMNKLPGPKGVPIFGNVWDFIFIPYEDIVDTLMSMLLKQQEAGHSLIGLWFGHFGKVLLLKGSSAEVILRSTKHLNKSLEYRFATGFLGEGLLYSKRELWEKRRKIINPSFHWGFLKGLIPMFNEKVEILMELLEKVEEKGPFDIDIYFSNFSLDVLCQSVLGVNVNAQRDSDGEIVRTHHAVGDIYLKRTFNPLLWPSVLYYWTSLRKLEVKCNRILRQFSWKVIQERRKYLELLSKVPQDCGQDEGGEVYGMKRRKAMLDILLQSSCDGKKLTDQEVMDEVAIQIAAGHKTTASSMTFTLFLLGHHLDIQKLVQEELDQILGDSDRPLTSNDVNNMKLLDAVLKESYRLYPAIPVIARELEEDVVIDGYTVPANTTLAIPIFVIHRYPEVFPDPEKFIPERFMGFNSRKPSIYEYMPFSAGPRNCIGNKMAQTETKIALAQILRKYEVISRDKPEDLKLLATPDLRSFTGIKISLWRRNKCNLLN